ncbi:unnamed protein product [Penicillium salamii]|nr:unnamed protein product [Penicillium salamii]
MQKHKNPVSKSRLIIKGASKSPLSVDIRFDIRSTRVQDYWRRANEALKEKEEASGGKDYIDTENELFSMVNRDGMVGDK